jgi:hypothetical protein
MLGFIAEPHVHMVHGDHPGGAPEGLGLILGIGIPALVLTILAVVFLFVSRAVRRRMAEERLKATQEGIVLDSGPVWMTVRYRGFQSAGLFIGVGIRKSRVTALLTRERLAFLPWSRHYFTIARADLARFKVGVAEDGGLRIHTEDPPGASGSIDYRIPVADASAWVSALAEAGAQRA